MVKRVFSDLAEASRAKGTTMMCRTWIAPTMMLAASVLWSAAPNGQVTNDYQTLVRIFQEIRGGRGGGEGAFTLATAVDRATGRRGGGPGAGAPGGEAGGPDYSPAGLEARATRMAMVRQRLAAINPDDWPISQKVDYLLTVAQINHQDFQHRVLQPWARDPGHYVDTLLRFAMVDFPIPPERLPMFKTQLENIPKILEQARTSLTKPSSEFGRFAIFYLENTGGVNNREPRRAVLPQGAVGWYRDLIEQATKKQPELVEGAKRALAAIESYRDWIKTNMKNWTEPGRIGLGHYGWYLRHVKYIPLSVDQIRWIGQAEWDRTRAFLAIEQNRNKIHRVSDLTMADAPEELERRIIEAEKHLRAFIIKYKLLTIPADVADHFESEARWIVRPDRSRNFWERHVYRNPLQIHIHASIPGHVFQGVMRSRLANPIRRQPFTQDTVNSEGWAVWLEEMLLQAGVYDNLPRAKENAYIAQLFRAARVTAELNMQAGKWSAEEVIKFWMDEIPMMEENLARQDATHGLRSPTNLINTVTGKFQVEHLLADRMRQLGDKFDLGQFHDQLLQMGMIPWALIRWELTGLDDEIKPMWEEARKTLHSAAGH